MTAQERVSKLKQAEALILEVVNDMDRGNESAGEGSALMSEARVLTHKAYLRLKREVWKQPLGVK